jgi:hypothetical protein
VVEAAEWAAKTAARRRSSQLMWASNESNSYIDLFLVMFLTAVKCTRSWLHTCPFLPCLRIEIPSDKAHVVENIYIRDVCVALHMIYTRETTTNNTTAVSLLLPSRTNNECISRTGHTKSSSHQPDIAAHRPVCTTESAGPSKNPRGSVSYAHPPTGAHMHIFDPSC